MSGNKQIVYSLSTYYPGSHFLALMLGSHLRCIAIGIWHHFPKHQNRTLSGHSKTLRWAGCFGNMPGMIFDIEKGLINKHRLFRGRECR